MGVEVTCKLCFGETEDDGYGDVIHAESGLYWHGDRDGKSGHVATL